MTVARQAPLIDPHRLQFTSPVCCRKVPCDHLGPCNTNSQCKCHYEGSYCERNCSCDLTCEQFTIRLQFLKLKLVSGTVRWKGCSCRGNTPCSIDSSCPCRQTNRECDPELCLRCARHTTNDHRSCKNMQLQLEDFKVSFNFYHAWLYSDCAIYRASKFALLNTVGVPFCYKRYKRVI